MKFKPSYLELYNSGKLKELIIKFEENYKNCTACPHHCKINRFKEKSGFCKTGSLPFLSSYNAHFGEEPPLVGFHGSGTIFFSNCNMRCIFCQNCEISQLGHGNEIDFNQLANIMLVLQNHGCHNINFVSPSHQIYAILKALEIAIEKGLTLPLVYNSSGYDSKETIILLNKVFDIYMPDFKYFNNEIAKKLSGIENYDVIIKNAITEMHKQVGDLKIDEHGIAYQGLIIRHLILPDNLSQTKEVIDFISELSINSYLNLMDQYRPEHKAYTIPSLKRRITFEEYQEAVIYATQKGMNRLAS